MPIVKEINLKLRKLLNDIHRCLVEIICKERAQIKDNAYKLLMKQRNHYVGCLKVKKCQLA